jgi:hypothetical protein
MFSNAYLTQCNTNKDIKKQHQNTIGIVTAWIENLKKFYALQRSDLCDSLIW